MLRNHGVILIAFVSSVLSFGKTAEANDAQPPLAGLLSYGPPAFPAPLRPTAVGEGYAIVAFTVDRGGRVDDAVTLEASHPAFGAAIIEALPAWVLEPDSKETIPRREVVQFDFKRDGAINVISHMDGAKDAFTNASVLETQVKTLPWQRLEQQPQRLVMVNPAVPRALRDQFTGSTVTVNFVIDEQGLVHVPAVPSNTQAQLAQAILTAVKQWRFSPPIYEGRPVVVEVTRSFSFTPSKQD